MPGFLGGSSGSSGGTGGEITFPKEFIDPVTKLRVSEPQTLIDTDFEYGLQPTKWETVELINNTPSFFSKSGDTTIPGIIAIVTNAGTREITVTTVADHGQSVGIPISVTGTKSVTADGTYIINSIPNSTTFTYLCRDNQPTTASIEDLYSSIITGEFFQGSQIRISDSAGMVTDGETPSTITVTTPSAHGFRVATPFYFLNLNSTISQEFAAANTETKSFDASNSATAQTFDGSNTLSSINIDFSNSAVVGGTVSNISAVSAVNDTITVTHTTENFVNKPIGTPLYYNVVTGSGYFATNPRGVVFLKTLNSSSSTTSTFQVSATPDGDVIDIVATITGTFQLANQARTFAGNNVNPLTEQVIALVNDTAKTFNGSNTGGLYGTNATFSGSNITVASGSGLADLDWYQGAMVLYTTTGSAAGGLTADTTYFIDSFFQQGTSTNYSFTLKPLPNGSVITTTSSGTGVHTFTQIGLSTDKNVFHVRDHGYQVNDMLRYEYPVGGHFSTDQAKDFYFVQTRYDSHNFTLSHTLGEITPLTQSNVGTFAGSPITPTTMNVVGFQSPLTFAVTSGTLPTGLTLNTSTGVISGTPTTAYAQADVTVTLTDSTGAQAFQVNTFQFNPPPALFPFTSMTVGTTRAQVGPNNSNNSYASSRQEHIDYFNNTGQGAMATLLSNGTYFDMPSAQGYLYFEVPISGTYRLRASGGGGGGAGAPGGSAALVGGDFALNKNDVLWITIGISGGNGNYGGGDYAGGAGGGLSVIAKSNVTGKGFNAGQINPLLVAAGAVGAREPRFGYSPGYGGDAGQGGGGGGFYSNWRNNSMGGSGSGYNGQYSYGGWGGGVGTDDGYGGAGGYDGLYTGSPNSFIEPSASNQLRSSGGGSGQQTNGYVSITKL